MNRAFLENAARSSLLQWVGEHANSQALAEAMEGQLHEERSHAEARLKEFTQQGRQIQVKPEKGQRRVPDALDLFEEQAVSLKKRATSLKTSVEALSRRKFSSRQTDEMVPVSVFDLPSLSGMVLRTDPFTYEVRVAAPNQAFQWTSDLQDFPFPGLNGTASLVRADDIEPSHQVTFRVELPYLTGEISFFSIGYGEGVFYERGPADDDPFVQVQQQLKAVAKLLGKAVYGI